MEETWEVDIRSFERSDGYLNIVVDTSSPMKQVVAHVKIQQDQRGLATTRSYLIAAAPELLEALEKLLEEVDEDTHHGLYRTDLDDIRARSHAVIDKALGGKT